MAEPYEGRRGIIILFFTPNKHVLIDVSYILKKCLL